MNAAYPYCVQCPLCNGIAACIDHKMVNGEIMHAKYFWYPRQETKPIDGQKFVCDSCNNGIPESLLNETLIKEIQ